jgi:HD superfamily phosphohydrolase
LLSIISDSHENDFPQRPLFRSIHFLATRLLNGANESKRSQSGLVDQVILTETFGGLQPYDYKTIYYKDLSEVLVDLEKELGSWNPEDKIPELGNYAKNVVRVVPDINTVITPRLRKLLEHPLLARLKMISQLGLVTLVYPTADHSRYDHVLGAYTYTASYVNSLFHDSQNPIFRNIVDEQYLKGVLLAALFHDLGQYPLAHDLGEVEPKIFGHSSISIELLSNPMVNKDGKTLAEIIEGPDQWNVSLSCLIKILKAHSGRQPLGESETRDFKADMLSALIDGPIDADKADYIVRDSAQCRIPYGRQLDIERLLRVITAVPIPEHLRVRHKVTIGVYEKGRASADAFSLARYLLYSSVYWHHTSRISKAMLQYATAMLLPRKVFDSSEDEIKQIRAKLFSFLVKLTPPFDCVKAEMPPKSISEKEDVEGKKTSENVLKMLKGNGGLNSEEKRWYPGISWTDWLMLEWIKSLSDNPRGIALINLIQKRELYKRVLTIPRNEHNRTLIEALDTLSWPKKIALSEKIQSSIKVLIEKKAPEIHTKSLSCPDDVEDVLSKHLAILVDVPSLKRITNGRPLIYMPELERKTYYHPSTLPSEAVSLTKAEGLLLESVSPVRILCHPDLRQWLHYCVNQTKLLELIDGVLEEL